MNVDRKLLIRLIVRAVIIAGGMSLVLYFSAPGRMAGKQKQTQAILFSSMSTFASAQLTASKKDYSFEPAFETVREELKRAERICNYFSPESELGRLNATAADAPFACSNELWKVLTIAREWHKKTDGAFDITITPLMNLWGFYVKEKKVPSEAGITETMKLVGLDKVKFDDDAKTVFFPVKGMSLNLGGIAKGWALDRAVNAVQALHPEITEGFLNLGGNVLAFGGTFKGGVRDPFDRNRVCATTEIKGNCAMSTSGTAERFVEIDGKKYGHIIDPRTGYPVDHCFSATVLAESAVLSDVLSTALFVNGFSFAAKIPENPVLLIRRDSKNPDRLEVLQTGDCWTLDLPVTIPEPVKGQ